MKQWHNWCLLGTVVFLAVFGGPMIINWLYQSNSGYITIWGAAEVFSYYGTILAAILAAIVAVVGVHISIRASHEQYREDKRRDVLPYFAINMLDRKCINPVDWEMKTIDDTTQMLDPNAIIYKEFPFDKNYFIFCNDEIRWSRQLSKEQDAAKQTGRETVMQGDPGTLSRPVGYAPFEICNVGKGCAINAIITISSISKELISNSLPISVPSGGKMYVGLLLYPEDSLLGSYDIKIDFCDIYNNKYVQQKSLTIVNHKQFYVVTAEKETTHEWVH